MPTFSGSRAGFTPSTTSSNWVLEGDTAGDVGSIVAIGWGGELTTSTAYRTRWVRATTAGVGAGTALASEAHTPGHATPLISLYSGYATTEEVLPAAPDALHLQSWNAHGGLGYVALPLAAPWQIVNGVLTATVSCRNLVGTDANGSSYSVTWTE